MTAWLLEVTDMVWALTFGVSIILFVIALLIRYGKEKEPFTSYATHLLHELQNEEMQDKIGVTATLNGQSVFMTNFPVQIKELYFRLDESYRLLSHEYHKLHEAYRYMQIAAILALVAFLVLRLMHFKA